MFRRLLDMPIVAREYQFSLLAPHPLQDYFNGDDCFRDFLASIRAGTCVLRGWVVGNRAHIVFCDFVAEVEILPRVIKFGAIEFRTA
jgi:hypothetical protein